MEPRIGVMEMLERKERGWVFAGQFTQYHTDCSDLLITFLSLRKALEQLQ